MASTQYAPPRRRVSFAAQDERFPPSTSSGMTSTLSPDDHPIPSTFNNAYQQRVQDELRGLAAFASLIGDTTYPDPHGAIGRANNFNPEAYYQGVREGYAAHEGRNLAQIGWSHSTDSRVLDTNARNAGHDHVLDDNARDVDNGDSHQSGDTLQRFVDARNQALTPEERVEKLRDELRESKKEHNEAKVNRILEQLYDETRSPDRKRSYDRPPFDTYWAPSDTSFQDDIDRALYDGPPYPSGDVDVSHGPPARHYALSELSFSSQDSYVSSEIDPTFLTSPSAALAPGLATSLDLTKSLLAEFDREDAFEASGSARELEKINTARAARCDHSQSPQPPPSDISEMSRCSTYSNPSTGYGKEEEEDYSGRASPFSESEIRRVYRHVDPRDEPPVSYIAEDRGALSQSYGRGQDNCRPERLQRYSSNEGRARDERPQDSERNMQTRSYDRYGEKKHDTRYNQSRDYAPSTKYGEKKHDIRYAQSKGYAPTTSKYDEQQSSSRYDDHPRFDKPEDSACDYQPRAQADKTNTRRYANNRDIHQHGGTKDKRSASNRDTQDPSRKPTRGRTDASSRAVTRYDYSDYGSDVSTVRGPTRYSDHDDCSDTSTVRGATCGAGNNGHYSDHDTHFETSSISGAARRANYDDRYGSETSNIRSARRADYSIRNNPRYEEFKVRRYYHG